MTVAIPIKDMKNTASFRQLVDENNEVIVTKNGYTAFHCVSASKREAELKELAEAKLMQRISKGENEISNGNFHDISELEKETRRTKISKSEC